MCQEKEGRRALVKTEASWSDQGSKLSVTTHYLDGIEPLLSFPQSSVCPVAEIGMYHPNSPYGRYSCLSCWESCGQRFQLPSPNVVSIVSFFEWLVSSDASAQPQANLKGHSDFSGKSHSLQGLLN